MSEYFSSNVSIGDLETVRALAIETIGEDYLNLNVADRNGRFVIYDSVRSEAELPRNTDQRERFYSFMTNEEDNQTSMSLYYREYGLDKPMSMPARLEGFRFKWSENGVLFAQMMVELTKNPEFTKLPDDDELIQVLPGRKNVEVRQVTHQDINHLWGRLCDMAMAGFNRQVA